MSKESLRKIGLSMITAGLILATSSIIEKLSVNPKSGVFLVQFTSGKGLRYSRSGLEVLIQTPCELIPEDPQKTWGSYMRGPGKAIVAVKYPPTAFDKRTVVDTSICRYPLI